MTTLLFMPDIESNYLVEFKAKIVEAKGSEIILDRTAFYPEGGGQPSDTGSLMFDGGEVEVTRVTKTREVIHHVEGEIPDGVLEVNGKIDWQRRYALMKMHTAQHIVSGVVFDLFGSETVGNQIHVDRSRIDFHPLRLSFDDMREIESESNRIAEEHRKVDIFFEDREVLEERIDPRRVNLSLIPRSVRRLRVVGIAGFDEIPCAGTHVRNTGETGGIRIMDKESKGQGKIRITYSLL